MTEVARLGPNMAVLKFRDRIYAGTLGRNGYSYATGLKVQRVDEGQMIWLYPTNTRGEDTQCRISVPREDLPALIKELQRLV